MSNDESLRNILALTGRIQLAEIFVLSGFNKVGGFEGTAGYMASKGLPMAEILLVLTILGGMLYVAAYGPGRYSVDKS